MHYPQGDFFSTYVLFYSGYISGVKKFWIYKMSKGVPLKKDEKECYDWYIRNKGLDTRHQLSQVMDMIRCPGNNILLRFDPRYTISRLDRINRVLCYASMVAGRNAVRNMIVSYTCSCKRKII